MFGIGHYQFCTRIAKFYIWGSCFCCPDGFVMSSVLLVIPDNREPLEFSRSENTKDWFNEDLPALQQHIPKQVPKSHHPKTKNTTVYILIFTQ